jgi:hypothetical protein
LPGQDAFGAIQEIVAILDADPNTDWSGGADRCGVVALLDIEQAVPDERIDLAIADFDHQTAQAATPAFAMQTHAPGWRSLP